MVFNLASSVGGVFSTALPFVYTVVLILVAAGIAVGGLMALSYFLSFKIPFYYDELRNDSVISMIPKKARVTKKRKTQAEDELQVWTGWFRPVLKIKPPQSSDYRTLPSGKRYLYYVFWQGLWLPKRTRQLGDTLIDEFDPSDADINWLVSKGRGFLGIFR